MPPRYRSVVLKVWSQANSISIIWQLAKHAASPALLQTSWMRNSGDEAQQFTFNSSSRWFWYMLMFENHWYKLSFALPDRTGLRLKYWKAHSIGLPKVICNYFLPAWVVSGYNHLDSLIEKSLMFIAEIKYVLYLNNCFWLESYFGGSASFYLCAVNIFIKTRQISSGN